MFTIAVRYSKDGIVAMNLKADCYACASQSIAHEIPSFYVEIKNRRQRNELETRAESLILRRFTIL
jgi:hypothetical protein